MGLEKGFQWAGFGGCGLWRGFGGCGGGLVGVEVPPPPSLEDPTDTSFSSTAQLNQTDQCNGSVQFHGQAWQCKKI